MFLEAKEDESAVFPRNAGTLLPTAECRNDGCVVWGSCWRHFVTHRRMPKRRLCSEGRAGDWVLCKLDPVTWWTRTGPPPAGWPPLKVQVVLRRQLVAECKFCCGVLFFVECKTTRWRLHEACLMFAALWTADSTHVTSHIHTHTHTHTRTSFVWRSITKLGTAQRSELASHLKRSSCTW